MWKNVLTLLLIITGISFLVLGQIHWRQKIHQSVQQALTTDPASEQIEGTADENDKRLSYAAHLPSDLRQKIQQALQTKHPLRLVIVGSEATATNSDAWPSLFKQQLEAAYGPQVFSVVVKEYKGMTTKEALEENLDQDIIHAKPDVLLWEPFLLNNNGVVAIEDALTDITAILQSIRSALPDMVVMLQPPHPIYHARYYPLQVEELKKFAETNDYIYLDHWSRWPDDQSTEIQAYLDAATGLPNREGNRIWADFLIDYFIAQK